MANLGGAADPAAASARGHTTAERRRGQRQRQLARHVGWIWQLRREDASHHTAPSLHPIGGGQLATLVARVEDMQAQITQLAHLVTSLQEHGEQSGEHPLAQHTIVKDEPKDLEGTQNEFDADPAACKVEPDTDEAGAALQPENEQREPTEKTRPKYATAIHDPLDAEDMERAAEAHGQLGVSATTTLGDLPELPHAGPGQVCGHLRGIMQGGPHLREEGVQPLAGPAQASYGDSLRHKAKESKALDKPSYDVLELTTKDQEVKHNKEQPEAINGCGVCGRRPKMPGRSMCRACFQEMI